MNPSSIFAIICHHLRPMKNLPTAFQRSALWTAITALSITLVGALAIGFIYLGTQVIGFLQLILMPLPWPGASLLAGAGAAWLERKGLKRQRVRCSSSSRSLAWDSLALAGGFCRNPRTDLQPLQKRFLATPSRPAGLCDRLCHPMEREYGIPLPAPLADLVDASKTNSPAPATQTSPRRRR